jgi:TfoX/Sxy family transcriptional regulator of competence genes
MAYDEHLAARIRASISGASNLVEKKMFGGIGWTVGGHLAAGAHNDGKLMIRCAKEDHAAFLTDEGAGGMMRGGRAMMGWVLVDADAVADDAELDRWVGRGRDYASGLPPKKP